MTDARNGGSDDNGQDAKMPEPRSPIAPGPEPAETPSEGTERRSSVFDYFSGEGNNWVKLALAVAAMSAYILTFIPPFTPEDADITMLAATPIVVFAWLFGFWGGTAAAVVMIPLNALLFSLATEQSLTDIVSAQEDLLPAVLLLVLGAVLGVLCAGGRDKVTKTRSTATRPEKWTRPLSSGPDGTLDVSGRGSWPAGR